MKKVLVVRNDKIGDFMLAWPSFAMLKQSLPDTEVTALVPSYTAELATLCPWIDEVIVDCGENADKDQQKTLLSAVKTAGFDASICLFSDAYNAKLMWGARIPFRLAPATKIWQFLYNHRITQRRSRSEKPEYEYNLDLIRAFLTKLGKKIVEPEAPYLTFDPLTLDIQREKLAASLNIDVASPWLFVHAGSGGSANNLSLEQYRELISGIVSQQGMEVVLTAGPGEKEKARELQSLLKADRVNATVYDKNAGLQDFTCSIACASFFIAGSTGPLHIAATVDVPTVGFYPNKRSATPLRWRTINSKGRHVAFAPDADKDKDVASDMSRIKVNEIVGDVLGFMRR
ncbi:ADP-heptose--LPS heptosyltransferase [Veronia nyctiphanis]|uniref:ADP-heptose--LPS heptosyltransferase n=1 Tax=Veronia nyctiphanis TaxID=1278244 RepID=A0A4Q0YTT2_9GAMM|nr:glycosyltransferase family 9 protein [Veronia nyctiphanis]RXJ73524.1 ADP-heptose--LPS heptosyltransferase [Veronia nyctiphanis]